MLFAWNRLTKCEEKRTRPVRALTVISKRIKAGKQKLDIQLSKHGGPVGDNYRSFVDEVVMYTRKRAPIIRVKSWKNVMEEVRNTIATDVLVIIDFAFQYNSNKN
jgi:hypothetical protein